MRIRVLVAGGAAGPTAGELIVKGLLTQALFRHNADGSWHVAEPMMLQPASGPIPLKPSRNFRAGTLFGGFDLAAALDGACAH